MNKPKSEPKISLYYRETSTGGSTPTCSDGSSDTKKKLIHQKKEKSECKSSSLETLQEIWSATAGCAGDSQNKLTGV